MYYTVILFYLLDKPKPSNSEENKNDQWEVQMCNSDQEKFQDEKTNFDMKNIEKVSKMNTLNSVCKLLILDGKIRQIKVLLDEEDTQIGLKSIINVKIPEKEAPKINKEPEMSQAVITMYR